MATMLPRIISMPLRTSWTNIPAHWPEPVSGRKRPEANDRIENPTPITMARTSATRKRIVTAPNRRPTNPSDRRSAVPTARILSSQVDLRHVRPESQQQQTEEEWNRGPAADAECRRRSPLLATQCGQTDHDCEDQHPEQGERGNQVEQPEVPPQIPSTPAPQVSPAVGPEPLPAMESSLGCLPVASHENAENSTLKETVNQKCR